MSGKDAGRSFMKLGRRHLIRLEQLAIWSLLKPYQPHHTATGTAQPAPPFAIPSLLDPEKPFRMLVDQQGFPHEVKVM